MPDTKEIPDQKPTGGELVRLAWDSQFFGFEVARWQPPGTLINAAQELVSLAKREKVRLVYWLTPQDGAVQEAADAVGARLVDRKVTYVCDTGHRPSSVSAAIRLTSTKTDRLLSLALQSGEYSRFRVDEQMPTDSFKRLYSAWLDASLSGAIAREVLVFQDGAEELGFITLGVKNARLDIGLLAVDLSARGKGIGKTLVDTSFQRASSWGYSQVQVVTQEENVRACRFYEALGFKVAQVEHVYHLWL